MSVIVRPNVILNYQKPGPLEREYMSRDARPLVNGREIKLAWYIDSGAGIVKSYDVIGDQKHHSFVEALTLEINGYTPPMIAESRKKLRQLMEELGIRDLGKNERLQAMTNPARPRKDIELTVNGTVWSRTFIGNVEIVDKNGARLDLL